MPMFFSVRKTLLSAAVIGIAWGLFGCAPVSGPDADAENAYARPLPAEDAVVWVSDNTAALYGVPDGKSVPDGSIAIDSAEALFSIGTADGYPMDGDYVLTADLDLTGTSAEPIGGAASGCGIVSGDNVFSGTFDGRGHTIRGLTMVFDESVRVHVGLFGSLGSDDPDDPAVVRNLILKEVSLSGDFSDVYTMGTLAGQASGYVQIDNIAVLSGSVAADSGDGSLGVGGLIGQIRTQTDIGCSNEGVILTDIYCGVQVEALSADVTGALIGRIRASDLGELSRVVITGQARAGKEKGKAVCGGDSVPLVSENVWYITSAGVEHAGIGQSRSSSSLQKLPGDGWRSAEGLYAMPDMVWDSAVFSPALDSLHLKVAAGDTVDRVQFGFSLPSASGGQSVTWTSDNPDHLRIEGNAAIVTRPAHGSVYARLTASAGEVSRTYTLRIVSGEEVSLTLDGNWLIAEGYPAGTDYCWITEDIATGEITDFLWNTTGRFLLTGVPEGSRVLLRSAGYDQQQYVPAEIPTLYIDCRTGYYGLTKAAAQEAQVKLVTPDGKTEYSGGGQIKLRGNSSAGQEKRPFKLKLDTKSNLFGMGKNRHWVLLANWYDRTNLRNAMSY
ncbi:MAG: CotH kinase family protein, partial [Clostridia bacterium]|nr:CotH kinase family protein [Clostridia bacterium]